MRPSKRANMANLDVNSDTGDVRNTAVGNHDSSNGVIIHQAQDPKTETDAILSRSFFSAADEEAGTACKATARRQWTPREKSVILCLALAKGLGFAGLTVIAPIFPALAKARGMSTTEEGLVFSSLNFAALFAAPFFGILVPKIGVRMVVIAGLLVAGASSIGFGLMEEVLDPTMFAVGCFGLRITLGIAFASYMTGIFSVVTTMFREETGRALGIVEASIAIGVGAGPPIASALFRVGGYKVPIMALGTLLVVATVPLAILLPPTDKIEGPSSDKESRNGSVFEPTIEAAERFCTRRKSPWRILVTWEPSLALLSVAVVALATVYFQPILQPFLEFEFGTTETEAGFVFVANLGSYCLATPIAGFVSDAHPRSTYLHMISGMMLGALGCLIVGPADFLLGFIPRSLWTTVAGLLLVGFGFPFVIIPGYKMFSNGVTNAAFHMDVKTQGVASACWQSAFFFGEAVGPAIASGIAEYFDMAFSFETLAAIVFSMSVILAINAIIKRKYQQ